MGSPVSCGLARLLRQSCWTMGTGFGARTVVPLRVLAGQPRQAVEGVAELVALHAHHGRGHDGHVPREAAEPACH